MNSRSVLMGVALVAALAVGASLAVLGMEAAAGVPALVAGVAVLIRPIVGLFAVVFPIPFEAVFLFGGGATVTKLVGAAVAGLWFAQKIIRGDSWRDLLSLPFVIATVLFISWAGLSFIWAEYPSDTLAEIPRLLMFLTLALIVIDLVRTWDHGIWLARVLVIGGFIGAVLVLNQYFGTGVRRAGGAVAGGINETATVLVTLLPFGFLLIRSKGNLFWRFVGTGYVAVALSAVAVTFSRMSFLLVPLVLLYEAWETLRKGRGWIGAAAFTLVVVLVTLRFVPLQEVGERVSTIGPYLERTLSGRTPAQPTVSSRAYHLHVALEIFQDHPVQGAGYENYRRHFLQYQLSVPGSDRLYHTPRSPHSSFAGILADLGLVGEALWLIVLGSVLWVLPQIWSGTRSDRASRQFLLVRAVTLSFLLMIPLGFYAEMQKDKLFWVLTAMVVAVYRLVQAGKYASSSKSSPSPSREMRAEGRSAITTPSGSTSLDSRPRVADGRWR